MWHAACSHSLCCRSLLGAAFTPSVFVIYATSNGTTILKWTMPAGTYGPSAVQFPAYGAGWAATSYAISVNGGPPPAKDGCLVVVGWAAVGGPPSWRLTVMSLLTAQIYVDYTATAPAWSGQTAPVVATHLGYTAVAVGTGQVGADTRQSRLTAGANLARQAPHSGPAAVPLGLTSPAAVPLGLTSPAAVPLRLTSPTTGPSPSTVVLFNALGGHGGAPVFEATTAGPMADVAVLVQSGVVLVAAAGSSGSGGSGGGGSGRGSVRTSAAAPDSTGGTCYGFAFQLL
jgi:hypothetical protein